MAFVICEETDRQTDIVILYTPTGHEVTTGTTFKSVKICGSKMPVNLLKTDFRGL